MTTPRMRSELLTPKEVAAILKLTTEKVWDHIAAGELPAVNVGGEGRGRRYLIDERDLDKWLRSRRIPAP